MIKVLYDGSCKHYGFLNKEDHWNENENHFLATIEDGVEKGRYLNSFNKMAKYIATRHTLGPFFANFGYVWGYGPKRKFFWTFGYSDAKTGYEHSILPNPYDLTLLVIKTRYRFVEKITVNEDLPANPVDWVKRKVPKWTAIKALWKNGPSSEILSKQKSQTSKNQ